MLDGSPKPIIINLNAEKIQQDLSFQMPHPESVWPVCSVGACKCNLFSSLDFHLQFAYAVAGLLLWTLRLLGAGIIWTALVSRFTAGPPGCANSSSAGWRYSGCVQPLFWSGNVVSVGNWPDHTHNSHWEEGRFALPEPELSPLWSWVHLKGRERLERAVEEKKEEERAIEKGTQHTAVVMVPRN